MIKRFFLNSSLDKKLALMMLFLSLTLVSTLIYFYYKTEKEMYNEFERHIEELSKAIRVGMEEVSKGNPTDERRLKDYLKKLNTKGVREISIISTTDKIVSSTNPNMVGKWISKQKKELIFKADIGEAKGGGQNYEVVIPVISQDKHLGYIYLTLNTDDFSAFLKMGAVRRIVSASIILIIGIVLSIFLAKRYTKPIKDIVYAARRVASGDFSYRIDMKRKDEIGELAQSFNYMTEKLKEEKTLAERLRRAEHLAGIGQFSGSIAHEIKNPLNFINLSIDHVREKYRPPDPKEAERFDSLMLNIKKEIERVRKFSESFLNYVRPLELSRQKTDMAGLIDEVLGVITLKAKSDGVEIKKDYSSLPTLYVDPEFIKTCIYNLIINSLEAMPDGGILQICATQRDGRLDISLSDTGKGIAKKDIERVFEPFFTTKKTGLGLGLSLTKRIIEEHGGKLTLTPKEPSGIVATISLPIDRGQDEDHLSS